MRKYINILFHPFVLLLSWMIYLLSFASGLIRYYYIQNPETSFPLMGKLANAFWHLLPIFLVIFIVNLVLATWYYTNDKNVHKNRISFYIVGILGINTLFISNYLLGLELSNYNNYLYAMYGITKTSVYWLSNISLITIITFGAFIYLDRKKLIKSHPYSNQKTLAVFVLGILVWYSLLSFVKANDFIWYAKFTYDKMFENYAKIVELKNIIPENGALVIPPQSSTWPDISNAPIVRYFLFPRTIVSASYLTVQERVMIFDELYFVSLHKNSDIWPAIDAKKHQINFGESDLIYSELTEGGGVNGSGVYKITFKK